MKKVIVTTTIYKPSQALLKYISFNDWDIIIVGDKKTPHQDYYDLTYKHKHVTYLSPQIQERDYLKLSEAIGWNKIQRRTIGYLHAYLNNYEIIASVDDDNIPYDNWGKEIFINKEIEVYYYETKNIAFDPLSVTNYKQLWHRGFPVQLLTTKFEYETKIKKIIPKIQANFWNGDPDIDAICRLEHKPNCFFDEKYFPFSTNALCPFNQQNTIFSRDILKYYLALPYVGRMDDIWPSYYTIAQGFEIIYHKPTVFQDRNIQNLTKNMEDEFIGYKNTFNMLNDIKLNIDNYKNYLPEDAKKVLEIYEGYFTQEYM